MPRRTKIIALSSFLVVGIGIGWLVLTAPTDMEADWYRLLRRGKSVCIEADDMSVEIDTRAVLGERLLDDTVIKMVAPRTGRTAIMRAKHARISLEANTRRVVIDVEYCKCVFLDTGEERYLHDSTLAFNLREPVIDQWRRKLRMTLGL